MSQTLRLLNWTWAPKSRRPRMWCWRSCHCSTTRAPRCSRRGSSGWRSSSWRIMWAGHTMGMSVWAFTGFADQTTSIICFSFSSTWRTWWCLFLPPLHQSLKCPKKKVWHPAAVSLRCFLSALLWVLCWFSSFSGWGESGWGGREAEEEAGVCTHLRVSLGESHEGQRGADCHHETQHARTGAPPPRNASVQELQQVSDIHP